jgi:hypothetical protein
MLWTIPLSPLKHNDNCISTCYRSTIHNFTEIIQVLLCFFDFQSKGKYFLKHISPKICSEKQNVFVNTEFYVSFKLMSWLKSWLNWNVFRTYFTTHHFMACYWSPHLKISHQECGHRVVTVIQWHRAHIHFRGNRSVIAEDQMCVTRVRETELCLIKSKCFRTTGKQAKNPNFGNFYLRSVHPFVNLYKKEGDITIRCLQLNL